MRKYILCGVSLLTGGTIGYFIGYKKAIKKVQKIADAQVEDVKNSLKELYEDRIKAAREKNEERPEQTQSDRNKEMGVDPGINDIDSRTRFPGASSTVQPSVSIGHPPVGDPDNPTLEDILKRPRDLPPDAIDTPDGYPDPEDTSVRPYLLREKDYGSLDNFDTVELILWADGRVSANDSYCELVSPTKLFDLLPEDWTNKFDWDGTGKYASAIYFRNNEHKMDIEIVKDYRTYKEWLEEVYPGRADDVE